MAINYVQLPSPGTEAVLTGYKSGENTVQNAMQNRQYMIALSHDAAQKSIEAAKAGNADASKQYAELSHKYFPNASVDAAGVRTIPQWGPGVQDPYHIATQDFNNRLQNYYKQWNQRGQYQNRPQGIYDKLAQDYFLAEDAIAPRREQLLQLGQQQSQLANMYGPLSQQQILQLQQLPQQIQAVGDAIKPAEAEMAKMQARGVWEMMRRKQNGE